MAVASVSYLLLIIIYNFSNIVDADNFEDTDVGHGLGIVHGRPVNITDVPFFAIYRKVGQLYGCGASIIHEQFLVTVGSCISNNQPNDKAEVIVGTDNIHKGEKYEIEKTFIHPKYSAKHHDYDIGVIKLKKKLKFNVSVNKIKMADSSIVIKNASIFDTFGFGLTNSQVETSYPETLLQVKVPLFENEECATVNNHMRLHVTNRMICAGTGNYVGFNDGDQGGALRYKGLLLGLASWYYTFVATPAVYAYVPSMKDFIDKTIKDSL